MVRQAELHAFEDAARYQEFSSRPLMVAARKEFGKLFEGHSFDGKAILEVGCGGASFQEWYRGARLVVLTDVTPALLKLNGGSAAKVVCDGEFASFKNRSFHFIVLFGVVHHYSDRERGLQELKRLLVPGGTILMAEPRTGSLNVLYRFLRRAALRWVKPETLSDLIGCFSPDETLIEERKLFDSFRGYRLSFFRKFCLRFPPLPFLRHWRIEVFLNRLLDRIPGMDHFGVMLYLTIQDAPEPPRR